MRPMTRWWFQWFLFGGTFLPPKPWGANENSQFWTIFQIVHLGWVGKTKSPKMTWNPPTSSNLYIPGSSKCVKFVPFHQKKPTKRQTFYISRRSRYIYIYIYLEPKWPLFLKVNPPKQGLFEPKQGAPFGFQVYIYIHSKNAATGNRRTMEHSYRTKDVLRLADSEPRTLGLVKRWSCKYPKGYFNLGIIKCSTVRINRYVLRKGVSRSIPILFGWDWNPKNPIRSVGCRGNPPIWNELTALPFLSFFFSKTLKLSLSWCNQWRFSESAFHELSQKKTQTGWFLTSHF